MTNRPLRRGGEAGIRGWGPGVCAYRITLVFIIHYLIMGEWFTNHSNYQQFTYGVVSEGVFAESLRKFCGKFEEICKEIRFIAAGKGVEILQKFCRKSSAMTPSRTTPISQESLRQTKPKKGPKRKVHEFRPFL